MARRIADVRAALEILAGPDPRDPVSLPVSLTDADPGERLRIAVLADPPGGTTDPGIASAIRAAADRLADAGHDVVEATPPGYEEVLLYWAAFLIGEIRLMRGELDAVMGPGGLALLTSFDETMPPSDLEGQFALHAERYRLMREWSAFYAEHPVLLSPTWALPAFAHDADIQGASDVTTDTIRPVLPANFLGFPSAVTPAGVVDGLPVGLQVMGDRYTDLRCLTVAAEVESLLGTITPIEPVTS